ncbi:helix-turn-helix domain containing protein [Apilactobacillus apisilvae]|uniref:Helix-turn-helix domain containing protein n=1 Tax=Apilactobacillus apisilvae TaxID=2923364 RepID=A0ABY4PHY2_9LACO|nr:helix-turn-helix domain-containing protein [Apilactobacillus apisilvae]UQS85384.1 helix-turn-helix domain containing protein [Apilactobacillus apisilvae]
MTKYSTNLKIGIANTILNHQDSVNGLSKKYNIPKSNIKRWIYVARYQGLTALKVKHKKRNFSIEFKLKVVKYYLNHNLGINPVAAKFNLGPTTITLWTKIFNEL